MTRIKGKYVATVEIDFDFDKDLKDLKPFKEIKKGVFDDLTPMITEILQEELDFEEMGTVKVHQQLADLYEYNEGQEDL